MQVGSFGSIIFLVSNEKIQTVRDVTRNGSADIQTHKRHLNVDLPEFVGSGLESLSFVIRLSKYLGVGNPDAQAECLFVYMRNGTPNYFILGNKRYGRYKWLVSKCKVVNEHYDEIGNAVTIDVSVTLTEYPKR